MGRRGRGQGGKGGAGGRGESFSGGAGGTGGEMTQTLYAHMNKIKFKKKECTGKKKS
jgi:hypothetical protein